MDTKHTPGPWTFYTEPQPNGCPVVGASGLMVAMLAHSVREDGQKETALANARLIALAPELSQALDFLSGLHPCLTIDSPPMDVAKRIFDAVMSERSASKDKVADMERKLDFMRAAIAKATGAPT